MSNKLAFINIAKVWHPIWGMYPHHRIHNPHLKKKYSTDGEEEEEQGVATNRAPATAVVVIGNRIVFQGSTKEATEKYDFVSAWVCRQQEQEGGGKEQQKQANNKEEEEEEVIDCQGKKFLCPGFVDAHIHFLDSGRRLLWVDLKNTRSKEEFRERIRKYISANEESLGETGWVRGMGWTEAELNAAPTADWVDDITGNEQPLFLHRNDCHSALVNSVVLRMAGINEFTEDPLGGKIERVSATDSTPTGLLRETALDLVKPYLMLNQETPENLSRAMDKAQSVLLREGVTQCHHMSSVDAETIEEMMFLRSAAKFGDLHIRVRAAPRLVEWEQAAQLTRLIGQERQEEQQEQEQQEALRKEAAKKEGQEQKADQEKEDVRVVSQLEPSLMVSCGLVKDFIDGTLGSKTLYMVEPFQGSSDPNERGLLMGSMDDLFERAKKAHAAGLQLCFHAIGDGAVRLCLDLFDQLPCVASPRTAITAGFGAETQESTYHPNETRFRIEHCQNVHVDDFKRLQGAQGQLFASVQPLQLLGDIEDSENFLGAERSRTSAYPFKTLIDSGVPVAFGSDWMICFPSVLETLYVGCKRSTGAQPTSADSKQKTDEEKGKEQAAQGWQPHQCVSIDEALTASTLGGCLAGYYELDPFYLGEIAAGALADLTLLADDPSQCIDSPGITMEQFVEQCHVQLTVVNGVVRYRSADAPRQM